MRTVIYTGLGMLLAASSLLSQASMRAIVGDDEAVLAAIRKVCEDVVLDLREMRLDNAQLITSSRIRFAKFGDCERLEWWGEHSQGIDLPQTEHEIGTPEHGAPLRTLNFDGLCQVDWYFGRSKLDAAKRAWIGLSAAAPTLFEERPRFLRLLGLGRLGNWLWEPCPDGRPLVTRMLRPDLLLVASPVGDPEVHSGLFAYDLIYLDPATGLPQRIVEHLPAFLAPPSIDEGSLGGLVLAETTVEDRLPCGVPRTARCIHRSRNLINFEWTCSEASPVPGYLRTMLATPNACPVPDTNFPIRREDKLVAMMRRTTNRQAREASSSIPSARHARADLGSIGLLLAALGAALALWHHVQLWRSRYT